MATAALVAADNTHLGMADEYGEEGHLPDETVPPCLQPAGHRSRRTSTSVPG
jgi:hypothetical protein